MIITIETNELVFDISNKSHLEVANITDAEARYRAEAGTDKREEVERALTSSRAALDQLLNKYLVPDLDSEGCNDPGFPQYFTYTLRLSERRGAGKAQALADTMQSYLVNLTLAKFYHTVAQEQLASTHEGLASADAKLLTTLINTKQPPYIKL